MIRLTLLPIVVFEDSCCRSAQSRALPLGSDWFWKRKVLDPWAVQDDSILSLLLSIEEQAPL